MKKQFITQSLLVIIVYCFSSCSMAIKENIVNEYYLSAVDEGEQLALSYNQNGGYTVIIENTVFALGKNSKYLIVKQHPRVKGIPPNKSITNYYIVPIHNKLPHNPQEGVIGPLNKEQFDTKTKELGISDVEFSIVYKDLE